jgi:outer membrane protein
VLTLVLATISLAQTAPAAGAAAPATTAATTPGGVKVGIIDIQQAIIGTNEGARDFDTLQKKFEPKRNELSGLNTEIENLKKQLNTQGDKMNEEARATLVKSIESKQKVLQRQGEDAQNDYQQQQNEIAQRILQKMAPVIDKYAKANGYGLLFDSSNPWPQGPLLWATAGVDLTKAVVDAYNSQSTVAPPARPAGAPGATTGKPMGAATSPTTGAKPTSAAAKQ